MERRPQNLANHGKFDPPFHFFLIPLGLANFLISIWQLIKNPGAGTIWICVLSAALMVLLFRLRTYPLKAQDRVIRLEERLRMAIALPEPLRARIPELTERQLIALRFCPDRELPGLVEKALSRKMEPAEIKKAIVEW